MKYSLNQLKKYLPELSSVPVKELIDKIWISVAEVESVEDLNKKYEGIIVGKIVSVEKHPKSEHLLVTQVDIGKSEPVVVVTGAPNLQVGDFVPYIPVSGKVPTMLDDQGNPVIIGVRTMVGIPSTGMLASERELGISDNHDGIMILDQAGLHKDLIPGASLAYVLELDDIIIEIENKALTHRGDCFSAAGLAREISTLFGFELVIPEWQQASFAIADLVGDAFDKDLPCVAEVKVSAKEAVERYSALVLDDITVKSSPQWLQAFLVKHGVNPVNAVVDITNYVLLDYGQPMHAFDAATVSHKKRSEKLTYMIDVRYAKAGETLLTLDSKEKKMSGKVTVIADDKHALGIAGVIGGKESGISDTTTRVILESAVFNKYAIRNTSMSLGITTDASVVFSRKQDTEKTVRALLRVVHLMQELCGAIITSPISDIYVQPQAIKAIIVSHKRIESFLGIAVSPASVKRILTALGFVVTAKNDMYSIMPPSWRPDVTIDEDVYEEIARVIGYGEITPELPQRGIFGVALSPNERTKQASIRTLTGLGMTQGMNFSFVSKALYEKCQLDIEDARAIVNAVSPDVQYVRKQVIPGLLEQLAKNQHNAERFGIFELGKVSRKNLSYNGLTNVPEHMPAPRFGVDELGLPIEDEHIALGIMDNTDQPGFFTLKSIIEKYLLGLRIEAVYVHPSDMTAKDKKSLPIWMTELMNLYKKGRVAAIYSKVNHELLGIIGEPGTLVLKAFGITKQLAISELIFTKIAQLANLNPVYVEPSKYPTVTEDYCFEFPTDVKYSQVISSYEMVLKDIQNSVLVSIKPVDIYQKTNDKKQVTHRLVFSPIAASLSDVQMKTYREQIIVQMKKLNGKLI